MMKVYIGKKSLLASCNIFMHVDSDIVSKISCLINGQGSDSSATKF